MATMYLHIEKDAPVGRDVVRHTFHGSVERETFYAHDGEQHVRDHSRDVCKLHKLHNNALVTVTVCLFKLRLHTVQLYNCCTHTHA